MMQGEGARAASWARGSRTGLLLLSAAIVGCDFDVTNPGPIQDEFLDDAGAHGALANSGGRLISDATDRLAGATGQLMLEFVMAGNTGAGMTHIIEQGRLDPSDTNSHFELAQQARWVPEEAVRRMRGALGPDLSGHEPAAQALVWAGYGNRLLGENWCVAVINGGAAQPRRTYHERAEEAFTEAIEVARTVERSDLEMAAYAGRASVRVWLDDWTGAVADAEVVSPGFAFQARYSGRSEPEWNQVYRMSTGEPWRSITVWSTWYEQYFAETEDPRVPWARHPVHEFGSLRPFPFLPQRKYTSVEAPINLSSHREMRLILAEARLRDGDWVDALETLNDLRAAVSQPAVQAADLEETWTLLWQERAVELWLEGRQLGDRYRREAEGLPGVPIQDVSGRDVCFPIPEAEIRTNPNISGPDG